MTCTAFLGITWVMCLLTNRPEKENVTHFYADLIVIYFDHRKLRINLSSASSSSVCVVTAVPR